MAGASLSLETPASLEGERLDRGIAILLGLSRAAVARLLSEGNVRIGGAVARTGSRRLRAGDLLQVQRGGEIVGGAPPLSTSEPKGQPAPAPAVVFADEQVVVVDKPAGLVVHPGAGNSAGTLVQQLVALFPDITDAGPDEVRPGIVHRLDKGTSGLLVVARTREAREDLAKQMAARSVLRRYLAVVYGELPDERGVIEAPLGRSPTQRLRVAVVQAGRPARTSYTVLGHATSGFPATLVSCRLETGRTHQVRAHFAAIGRPVVADDSYAGSGQLARSREVLPGLRRPWLHATELGFVHPESGEFLHFVSAPPADLQAALSALGLELPG